MILVLAKQRNIATKYGNSNLIFVARAVSIGCMIEDLWTVSEIFGLEIRDGNGAGWGQKKGSSFPPHMVLSFPISALSHKMEKIFLHHPHPLGSCEAPPHPVKLYMSICSTTITYFSNKTYFINKNRLEITTKFIISNQTNF